MVLQVPPQSDDDLLRWALGLDCSASTLIEANVFGEGASLWTCPLRGIEGIGFWIGRQTDEESVDAHAYLALVPANIGGLQVLEAKKGWTEDVWRRRGLGRALLREACRLGPVLSDRDGMTDMAYAQWTTAPGFRRRWWDTQQSCFIDGALVPALDRFTKWAQRLRWQIVIENDT